MEFERCAGMAKHVCSTKINGMDSGIFGNPPLSFVGVPLRCISTFEGQRGDGWSGGRKKGRTSAHVARPSSAAGSSTVPVRVVLVQPTATGGETPPKLAGEDAYATSGGRRPISHSVLSAPSKKLRC